MAGPTFPQYQFAWLRDGAFIAEALDLIDESVAASRFHDWVASLIIGSEAGLESAATDAVAGIAPDPAHYLHCRYRADGTAGPLDWPTFQLDGPGIWLWSLGVHARSGRPVTPAHRQAAGLAARYLAALWGYPSYDAWEESPMHVHTSTLAAILAGLRALESIGPDLVDLMITSARDSICAIIESGGGPLTKWRGSSEVDGSLLWVASPYGLLDPGARRFDATLRRVEAELVSSDGGVHRYASDTYYGGGEWSCLRRRSVVSTCAAPRQATLPGLSLAWRGSKRRPTLISRYPNRSKGGLSTLSASKNGSNAGVPRRGRCCGRTRATSPCATNSWPPNDRSTSRATQRNQRPLVRTCSPLLSARREGDRRTRGRGRERRAPRCPSGIDRPGSRGRRGDDATTNNAGRSRRRLEIELPPDPRRGYALNLTLERAGEPPIHGTCVVEALAGWWESPRHAALTEMQTSSQVAAGVRRFAPWHVTVVQFYDWMYRHYQYAPPRDEPFLDALGRRVSPEAVREGIRECHRSGIAALAYGSVYGAEGEYIDGHASERVFDAAGKPLSLGETFFLTDLRPGPWRRRLMGEYERACRDFGFDGVHMDTYGDPHEGVMADGTPFRFEDLYPGLIEEAATRLACLNESRVLFNCVGGYPLDAVGSLRRRRSTLNFGLPPPAMRTWFPGLSTLAPSAGNERW